MRKSSFLSDLKKEGKLRLVSPSEEISKSYLQKATNCLRSAKILLKNNLSENSIGMSYYAMYNTLTSLLFRIGIKCENHSGSIVLFKKLFRRKDLFSLISDAKEERIDKQYYVTSRKNIIFTKDEAKKLLKVAEDFSVDVKLILKRLKNEDIRDLRQKFKKIV